MERSWSESGPQMHGSILMHSWTADDSSDKGQFHQSPRGTSRKDILCHLVSHANIQWYMVLVTDNFSLLFIDIYHSEVLTIALQIRFLAWNSSPSPGLATPSCLSCYTVECVLVCVAWCYMFSTDSSQPNCSFESAWVCKWQAASSKFTVDICQV